MRQRRCLIPASNYFEWEKCGDRKVRYAICPVHAGKLYLAGVHHLENHDGVIVLSFVILTQEAAPGIAFIHNRMPVILPRECTADWLSPDKNADEIMRSALRETKYQPA